MALNYVGSIGNNKQTLVTRQLKASTTFVVGEVVKSYDQDGVLEHGAAAAPVLGILTGIVDKYGNAIPNTTVTAGTASRPVVTSQATGTTVTYYGIVDTSNQSKWSAQVSGTLGTTNYSDKAGGRIDVDSANTSYGRLLETTSTVTVGTVANFYSHGTDPKDSTRLIVSVACSELDSVME